MNTSCPHCNKVIVVTVGKDSNVGKAAPSNNGATGEIESLLSQIDDDSLKGASAKFVAETRERFEKYGKSTRMSEKQMAWLRKLASGDTGESW